MEILGKFWGKSQGNHGEIWGKHKKGNPNPKKGPIWSSSIWTKEGIPREKLEEATARAFELMGAAHERVDTSRHPAMHKTKTIDYIILLSGDVTLLLDEDEVRLKPFNVVVQRGTNHAWVNNGNEPALLIAVLIDSDLKDKA